MEAVTGQLNTLDVRDEEEGTRATRLDTDAAEPRCEALRLVFVGHCR